METYVTLEFTPNPNTLKYSTSRTLQNGPAVNFLPGRVDEAELRSPLAARLLAVPGIAGVMIGKDFITVTKSEEGDWDAVHQAASLLIQTGVNSEEPIVAASAADPSQVQVQARRRYAGSDEDLRIEARVREFLEKEIRPAVAMDGGDISLDRFEDGVVYLHLQGSCDGCPSAAMTLKTGIEERLRAAMPEVIEVVAV